MKDIVIQAGANDVLNSPACEYFDAASVAVDIWSLAKEASEIHPHAKVWVWGVPPNRHSSSNYVRNQMRTVELNTEVKSIAEQDTSGRFVFIPVEDRLIKATKTQCLSIFPEGDDVHHCLDAIEKDIEYLQATILK